MTEKKESILTAALELFALEGYRSTSTSKVAKHAGVSEGLIFRHFRNKEGLLEAITQMGEERAQALFADVVLETDPKEVIKKYLDLALKTSKDKDAIDFWKLQFKIKWEMETYGEHKLEPLNQALTRAFKALGYEQPEMEAKLLLAVLDGVVTHFLLQKEFDLEASINFLKTKYEL